MQDLLAQTTTSSTHQNEQRPWMKTINWQRLRDSHIENSWVWQINQDYFVLFVLKQNSTVVFFHIHWLKIKMHMFCSNSLLMYFIQIIFFVFEIFSIYYFNDGIFEFKQWNSAFHEKMNMFLREDMTFDLLIKFCCFYWNSIKNRANMMIHILLKKIVIVRRI